MALQKASAVLSRISASLNVRSEEVLSEAILLWLRKKRDEILAEVKRVLDKYGASSPEDLEQKIARGDAPEHPAWEDLIIVENLVEKLKEIEEIMRDLQKPR